METLAWKWMPLEALSKVGEVLKLIGGGSAAFAYPHPLLAARNMCKAVRAGGTGNDQLGKSPHGHLHIEDQLTKPLEVGNA